MILTAIGIVMIYSASAIYANEQMKDSAYFLKRHLVYLSIGAVLAYLASAINYRLLRKNISRYLRSTTLS